jgi:ankyrin repeat protein
LVAITQLNYVRSSKFEPKEMLEQLKLIGRTTLFGMYEKDIARVSEIEDIRVRTASMDILSWLFHAFRPLTRRELREIVALSQDQLTDEEYLEALAQCDIFVAGMELEGEHYVGIRHETVQMFLADRCHDMLRDVAAECLAYLLIVTRLQSTFKDLQSLQIFVETWPFSRYAAKNWGNHLRGEPESRSSVQNLFKMLVSSSEKLECIAQLALNTVGPEDRAWFHRGKTWVHVVSEWDLLSLANYGMAMGFDNPEVNPYSILKAAHRKGHLADAHVTTETKLQQKCAVGLTGLRLAVALNRVPMVDFWLRSASWDLQERDKDGDTILHVACGNGFEEIAIRLLESGAETNVQNYQGSTPLHIACENKCVGIAAALLRHNADPNIADDMHWVPLHIAANVGSTELVELLLGFDVDVHARVFGWRAIHFAIWDHHLDIVRILLREGCYVKFGDGPGLLKVAAEVGDVAIVQLLLEAHPDMISVTNEFEEPPLHVAAGNGHVETVKLLLQRGADMHAPSNCCGGEALYKAAMKGQSEVVHELIRAGADVNKGNEHGITPLQISTFCGHEAIVPILLACTGLEINARCGEKSGGLTALHVAAMSGHAKIAEMLIEAGVDPQTRDNDGKLALHEAAAKGHTDIVKSLLAQFPGLVDVTTEDGYSSLFLAAKNGHQATVTALVHFQADYAALNGPHGATPSHIAAYFGHQQVLEIRQTQNARHHYTSPPWIRDRLKWSISFLKPKRRCRLRMLMVLPPCISQLGTPISTLFNNFYLPALRAMRQMSMAVQHLPVRPKGATLNSSKFCWMRALMPCCGRRKVARHCIMRVSNPM